GGALDGGCGFQAMIASSRLSPMTGFSSLPVRAPGSSRLALQAFSSLLHGNHVRAVPVVAGFVTVTGRHGHIRGHLGEVASAGGSAQAGDEVGGSRQIRVRQPIAIRVDLDDARGALAEQLGLIRPYSLGIGGKAELPRQLERFPAPPRDRREEQFHVDPDRGQEMSAVVVVPDDLHLSDRLLAIEVHANVEETAGGLDGSHALERQGTDLEAGHGHAVLVEDGVIESLDNRVGDAERSVGRHRDTAKDDFPGKGRGLRAEEARGDRGLGKVAIGRAVALGLPEVDSNVDDALGGERRRNEENGESDGGNSEKTSFHLSLLSVPSSPSAESSSALARQRPGGTGLALIPSLRAKPKTPASEKAGLLDREDRGISGLTTLQN